MHHFHKAAFLQTLPKGTAHSSQRCDVKHGGFQRPGLRGVFNLFRFNSGFSSKLRVDKLCLTTPALNSTMKVKKMSPVFTELELVRVHLPEECTVTVSGSSQDVRGVLKRSKNRTPWRQTNPG